MNRRKFIALGGATGLGLSVLLPPAAFAKVVEAKVYQYTFLKSSDAKPDDLIRFIVENWFAMDKIAVKRKLMTSYAVFESPPDEAESWNVAVVVGYPTKAGYEAIAHEFEKIQRQHKTVLVNGKNLKELGKIVGSRQFYPHTNSGG